MAGAGMKDIKRRIKSVESTRQITKAMELVASSKMRRAKERAERTQPQFRLLYETISDIASRNRDLSSTYVRARKQDHACVIVIAGDRGLAGGYNSNVFKTADALLQGLPSPIVVPIGKKAVEFYGKRKYEILDDMQMSVDELGLCRRYKSDRFDSLYVVYTKFVSALTQEPATVQIFPISAIGETSSKKSEILYEPSAEAVFEAIVPQYLAGLLNGAIAESYASEQAARRNAMESATDNADEMIEQLGLKYNRARQGAITQEITEIVAGAQAAQ